MGKPRLREVSGPPDTVQGGSGGTSFLWLSHESAPMRCRLLGPGGCVCRPRGAPGLAGGWAWPTDADSSERCGVGCPPSSVPGW